MPSLTTAARVGLFAALSASTLLHIYVSITFTRRFSPDSMCYVNVADNLAAGRGLVQNAVGFNDFEFPSQVRWPLEQPFTVQGPGYPLAIALLRTLGIPSENGALILSGAGYGLIPLLAWILLRNVYGEAIAAIAVAVLVVSCPVHDVTLYAWSEPMGVVFMLASLRLWQREGPRSFLAGLLAGAAFLCRYPLFILGPLGLAFTVFPRGPSCRRRAAAFAAGFLLLAAPVICRNALLKGAVTGASRPPSTLSLAANTHDAVLALVSGWRLVLTQNELAPVALLLVAIGLPAVRRIQARRWPRLSAAIGPRGIVVAAFLTYVAAMVVWRSILTFAPLNDRMRMLFPAHVLMLMLIAVGLGAGRWRPAVASLGAAAVVVAATLTVARAQTNTRRAKPSVRLNWESPLMWWVRENADRSDLLIAENAVRLTFYMGRPAVSYSAYPSMKHVEYADVQRLGRSTCQTCSGRCRVYLLVDGHPPLRRADLLERYGPFFADLIRGESDAYPAIERIDSFLGGLEGRVYRFRCGEAPSARHAATTSDETA